MTSKTKKGEAANFFNSVALLCKTDDCLIWPFKLSKKGYGEIFYQGKKRFVHRCICETVSGPPPSPTHEAAHKCGNRPCCNPKHLIWKTKLENKADELLHNTRNRGDKNGSAKLTEADIHQIRSLKLPRREIRELYGIGKTQLHNIIHKQKWSWLT